MEFAAFETGDASAWRLSGRSHRLREAYVSERAGVVWNDSAEHQSSQLSMTQDADRASMSDTQNIGRHPLHSLHLLGTQVTIHGLYRVY